MAAVDRRRAALDAYLKRPTTAALDRLRATMEGELIDRAALFSDDPRVIAQALNRAFASFTRAARSRRHVNWLSWIAATAMSAACGQEQGACWVDALTARWPGGVAERRAVVFGVILTLEGRCQWALLRRRTDARVVGPATSRGCRSQLLQRLRLVAV